MGRQGSGRKTTIDGHELQSAGQILSGAVHASARYLSDVVSMKVKKPTWVRVDVAKYIIDRELGKAKVMVEMTGKDGAPLSYQQLCILAEKAEVLIIEQAKLEGKTPEEVRARLLAPVAEKPPAEQEASPLDSTREGVAPVPEDPQETG